MRLDYIKLPIPKYTISKKEAKGEKKRKHQSRWATRQNKKDPVYFCDNCLQTFRTGRFSRFDDIVYDDICPYCGAPGMTFVDVVEEYKNLLEEENKRGKH